MGIRPAFRGVLARVVSLAILPASIAGFASLSSSAPAAAATGCQLNSANGAIKHVIEIQFDNVHFNRDNPNVPSDLEQMPNLLNFIQGNGTLDTNHHDPLISHTANDILTSITGVYADRHGVPVANSFRYFNPNGTSNLGVSFAYWTDPIFDPTTSTPTDTTYNMLTADGKNAPAPWVPYTRAGCDVGSVATANTVLENIGTDIPTVFGSGSAQAQEVTSNPNQAYADFVGIGVHCAQSSSLCSSSNGGQPDSLPQEPYGYTGYNALFGQKYVAPQISPSGPLTDLNGNVIMDPSGNIGFPGFDGMPAAVSLSYVAAMQEHSVPVTYAYISDAHDNHIGVSTNFFVNQAYGPGEAGYVAALKSYDDAFGKFFTRLANDGINKSNTLFVFTSDENDHYSGGVGTPAGCDGVNTPCTYSHTNCNATNPSSCPSNNVAETNANLAGLLATQQGVTTPFKLHADSAPTVYITGNPARDDATLTRPFDRAAAQLSGVDPQTGSNEQIMQRMADPVEMKLLHMVTADPARTPTLTYFALPQYFLFAGAQNCTSPCVTQPGSQTNSSGKAQSAFAWSHGDYQPDITTTWLGMVGPGVRNLGATSTFWSDHTDIRPTMLALLGLTDDYISDGRVLTEAVNPKAVAPSLTTYGGTVKKLGQAYKQINAGVGQLALATLEASTKALQSNSGGDDTYNTIENQLVKLGSDRDTLASQIKAALNDAEFNGQPLNLQQAQNWIAQAQSLINRANALAAS
ncbi:MAG TPA: hypothetical protein VHW91_06225 [Candidatus Dormibacteraeota bacterium]|jgi:hypothetical protein|nr:hypothetical protein [Candidatus Dormibacteraeota bacterium]